MGLSGTHISAHCTALITRYCLGRLVGKVGSACLIAGNHTALPNAYINLPSRRHFSSSFPSSLLSSLCHTAKIKCSICSYQFNNWYWTTCPAFYYAHFWLQGAFLTLCACAWTGLPTVSPVLHCFRVTRHCSSFSSPCIALLGLAWAVKKVLVSLDADGGLRSSLW